MSTNKLYSNEQVTYHKNQQKKSGRSIADYCRVHGIKPSTFYSWNNRSALPGSNSQKNTSPDFVEVPLRQQMTKLSCSRIRITRTDFDVPVDSLPQVSVALQEIFSSGNRPLC